MGLSPGVLRDFVLAKAARVGWLRARDFTGYLQALAGRPDYDFAYRSRSAFEQAGRLASAWPTIVVLVADYYSERASGRLGYRLSNYARYCRSILDPLAVDVVGLFHRQGHASERIDAPARAAACAAGLGSIGRNCLFYAPGLGSYVGICTLGTDWLGDDRRGGPEQVAAVGCVGCRRCISACPTHAIAPDGYRIDPLRCLSFLNRHAEEAGARLPADGRVLQRWLYGCEACQDVCPMNAVADHPRPPTGPAELVIHGMRVPNATTVDAETLRRELGSITCRGYAAYVRLLLGDG